MKQLSQCDDDSRQTDGGGVEMKAVSFKKTCNSKTKPGAKIQYNSILKYINCVKRDNSSLVKSIREN